MLEMKQCMREQSMRVNIIEGDEKEFLNKLKEIDFISEEFFEFVISRNSNLSNSILTRLCRKLKNTTQKFMDKHKNILIWDAIFMNNIFEEDILEYIVSNYDIRGIYGLNTRQKISIDFIENHKELINFKLLSLNENVKLEVFDKYSNENLNWFYISLNPYIRLNEACEFIDKHKDKLFLDIIYIKSNNLQNILMEKYKDEIKEKIEILEEFYDNNEYWYIGNRYSEYAIEKNILFGGWDSACKYNILNEYMIRKHQDEVNWEYLFEYHPYLSEEFKKEFEYKLIK